MLVVVNSKFLKTDLIIGVLKYGKNYNNAKMNLD